MKILKSKGFTIIELLVVVAIIAVLTAIVLVNVTQYIAKGKDASAQGDLASALTDSAVYASNNATANYAGLITSLAAPWTGDASTVSALNAANTLGYTVTTACNGTGNSGCAVGSAASNWCAMVTLKVSGNTFCVDSTGNKLNKAGGTCTTAGGATCQ